MSIYEEFKKAGVETDNHASDLYVPVNEATKKIISEYEFKSNVTTFVSNIDGKTWYDIPFAYLPFWDNKLKGAG